MDEFADIAAEDVQQSEGMHQYKADYEHLLEFTRKHSMEWDMGMRSGCDSTDHPAWPEACSEDYVRIIGPAWDSVEATS